MQSAPDRAERQADGKRSTLVVLLFALGLLLVIVGSLFAVRSQRLGLEIGLDAPGGPALQVFPYADGYSESSSLQLPLQAGTLTGYRLALQAGKPPKTVRIDPGSSAGRIELQHVTFTSLNRSVRVEGEQLRNAIALRNHLEWDADGQLIATGTDPWLEMQVPTEVVGVARLARRAGWGAAAFGLLLVAVTLALQGRQAALRLGKTTDRLPRPYWILLTLAGAAVLVMSLLGVPPAGLIHDPWRAIRYAGQLFLAALLFSIIGAALLEVLRLPSRVPGFARLFLSLAMGQCGLVAYLYLRSMLSAMGVPGVGRVEIGVLTLAAGYWLWRSRKQGASIIDIKGLPVQLGMLVAICLVVADRELPRVVMLSSDPDTHAFLSQRILSLGFLPWSGDLVFDYPGGSAFLGAAWSWLSGLDPRNAITALPMIACLTGAMLLAEAVAQRRPHPRSQAVAMLTALALTTAAFLFPMFSQYAHMEGTGRQVSFVFAAAIPAMWLGSDQNVVRTGWAIVLPSTLMLLTLAALNPISPVMPAIVLAAFWLHTSIGTRRVHPSLLALPAALLLLLDPYYQGLLQGAGSNPKITVTGDYRALALDEIPGLWLAYYTQHIGALGKQLLWLMPWHTAPTFLLLLLPIGALALAAERPRRPYAALFAAAALLVATAACAGLFFTLRTDPRGYLLPGYFGFSISQHGFMLLVILGTLASTAAAMTWRAARTLAAVLTACVVISYGMRTQQDMMSSPRHAYCGSLGCASQNDLAVLEMIRDHLPASMQQGKVLLPNLIMETANEAWVFPVAGGRALPFATGMEPAFFYYQGDRDFSSASYQENVCRTLDREWLASHRIQYVFLPESRAQACIQGMESLIDSERIVFQSGNSYLLELTPPGQAPAQRPETK